MNASGILTCAGAFLFVLATTPLLIALCRRWELFDPPGDLKIHVQPIPRLGGSPIVFAVLLLTFFAVRDVSLQLDGFMLAVLLIWAVGLIDDVRGLSPLPRLVAQAVAGGILWMSGWRLPLIGNGFIGLATELFLVVLFINVVNFLDGSDGLAAGVAGIIAASYIVAPHAGRSAIGTAVAWSLLGACVSFLAFNFPPAKIFMGDAGSTSLGLMVAFLSLDFYRSKSSASLDLLFPLLVSLLPLLDLLLAVLRRLSARVSPLQGDRKHFYDLLLARGWSAQDVALTSYAVTAALVLIARLEL